jgi:hypothetical protein
VICAQASNVVRDVPDTLAEAPTFEDATSAQELMRSPAVLGIGFGFDPALRPNQSRWLMTSRTCRLAAAVLHNRVSAAHAGSPMS